MYGETLPIWFWVIYYLFFLTTIGTAVFCIAKKKMNSFLSVIALVVAITTPIIGLVNAIGRGRGMNEYDYLVHQLQQGAAWSIFVTLICLYLLVWWALFLYKSKRKSANISQITK